MVVQTSRARGNGSYGKVRRLASAVHTHGGLLRYETPLRSFLACFVFRRSCSISPYRLYTKTWNYSGNHPPPRRILCICSMVGAEVPVKI